MSYTSPLTATLSGVTVAQLAYWRRDVPPCGPLLAPEYGIRPRVAYSYRDVIALRMFARLRERVSLQKVRKAVTWLQKRHPDTHLSGQTLLADPNGKTIVWMSEAGDYFDVVEQPGQQGITIIMQDIFRPFRARGRQVPDLVTPARGLVIDPEVRGGVPVLTGTRLPFNIVAGLRGDGLDAEAIRSLYPAVTVEGVVGAAEFAEQVDQWGGTRRAA